MSLDLDGEVILDSCVSAFDRIADDLLASLSGTIGKYPGAWVERKPGCLAVHVRALTFLDSTVLIEDMRDLLGTVGPDHPPLRSRLASRAIEIALAQSWTKAEAVAWMHTARGRNPFVVYVGDAANDEEAVDWVNARRGLTIGIGADAPWAAQIRVPTPADLAEKLKRLRVALSMLSRVVVSC
jgi:trehalose-phosphatase